MAETGAIDGDYCLTREELYDRARGLVAEGSSAMTKSALRKAIIKAYGKTKAGLLG